MPYSTNSTFEWSEADGIISSTVRDRHRRNPDGCRRPSYHDGGSIGIKSNSSQFESSEVESGVRAVAPTVHEHSNTDTSRRCKVNNTRQNSRSTNTSTQRFLYPPKSHASSSTPNFSSRRSASCQRFKRPQSAGRSERFDATDDDVSVFSKVTTTDDILDDLTVHEDIISVISSRSKRDPTNTRQPHVKATRSRSAQSTSRYRSPCERQSKMTSSMTPTPRQRNSASSSKKRPSIRSSTSTNRDNYSTKITIQTPQRNQKTPLQSRKVQLKRSAPVPPPPPKDKGTFDKSLKQLTSQKGSIEPLELFDILMNYFSTPGENDSTQLKPRTRSKSLDKKNFTKPTSLSSVKSLDQDDHVPPALSSSISDVTPSHSFFDNFVTDETFGTFERPKPKPTLTRGSSESTEGMSNLSERQSSRSRPWRSSSAGRSRTDPFPLASDIPRHEEKKTHTSECLGHSHSTEEASNISSHNNRAKHDAYFDCFQDRFGSDVRETSSDIGLSRSSRNTRYNHFPSSFDDNQRKTSSTQTSGVWKANEKMAFPSTPSETPATRTERNNDRSSPPSDTANLRRIQASANSVPNVSKAVSEPGMQSITDSFFDSFPFVHKADARKMSNKRSEEPSPEKTKLPSTMSSWKEARDLLSNQNQTANRGRLRNLWARRSKSTKARPRNDKVDTISVQKSEEPKKWNMDEFDKLEDAPPTKSPFYTFADTSANRICSKPPTTHSVDDSIELDPLSSSFREMAFQTDWIPKDEDEPASQKVEVNDVAIPDSATNDIQIAWSNPFDSICSTSKREEVLPEHSKDDVSKNAPITVASDKILRTCNEMTKTESKTNGLSIEWSNPFPNPFGAICSRGNKHEVLPEDAKVGSKNACTKSSDIPHQDDPGKAAFDMSFEEPWSDDSTPEDEDCGQRGIFYMKESTATQLEDLMDRSCGSIFGLDPDDFLVESNDEESPTSKQEIKDNVGDDNDIDGEEAETCTMYSNGWSICSGTDWRTFQPSAPQVEDEDEKENRRYHPNLWCQSSPASTTEDVSNDIARRILTYSVEPSPPPPSYIKNKIQPKTDSPCSVLDVKNEPTKKLPNVGGKKGPSHRQRHVMRKKVDPPATLHSFE